MARFLPHDGLTDARDPKVTLADTERVSLWASTMAGTPGPTGVALAHRGAASVGPPRLLPRERREQLEAEILSPAATRAAGAGSRRRTEKPDEYRTCFERDRDRILHATAFRRLAGKTQVFVAPSDHQRTRLTHALEVSQVATAIGRALGLNTSLIAAAAEGHDCGHGPGGHPSEDAFADYLPDGFDHAVWGADVVLAPLNLCLETLDAIRNHSWSRPAPSTPEGEVVSWADRIAYVCHDFEDAVSAGIVEPDDLPPIVRQRCGHRRPQQLDAFIRGVIEATSSSGHVGMTEPLAEALAAFRQTNYERIYMRPESRAQAREVRDLLQRLVEHFGHRPEQLPPAYVHQVADAGDLTAFRAAVTYVAGMTDRFALGQAVDLTGWVRPASSVWTTV